MPILVHVNSKVKVDENKAVFATLDRIYDAVCAYITMQDVCIEAQLMHTYKSGVV